MEFPPIVDIPPANLADAAALALILFMTVRGRLRGLSGELAPLASVLATLFLAMRLRGPLAALIRKISSLETPLDSALAFTVIAIAALIALSLLCRLLRNVMRISFTPGIEKGGGLAAGTIRGLALTLVVFIVLNLWPHENLNRVFGRESIVGRGVQRLLPRLRESWEKIEHSELLQPRHAGDEETEAD